MKLLCFLLLSLSAPHLYSQNCTALDRTTFFSNITFGKPFPLNKLAGCAKTSLVFESYGLNYDSLDAGCKKKYRDLFTFSSLLLPHVNIGVNKKGEIFTVDLWTPLTEADWANINSNGLPDKANRIYKAMVAAYGNAPAIEEEVNPDSVSRKSLGIVRHVYWMCNDIRIHMRVAYGAEIKVMNQLLIQIKDARFELVEQRMRQ